MHLLCATYASTRLGKQRIVWIFLFHCVQVVQMSIDSTPHDALMSLIQYLFYCNLGVQSQIAEFLESEKAHQKGNSGVEGS